MTYTPRTFTKIVDGNLVTEVADTPSEDVEFVFNGWTPQGEAPPRPPSVKDRVEDIEEELGGRLSEEGLTAATVGVVKGRVGGLHPTTLIDPSIEALPTGSVRPVDYFDGVAYGSGSGNIYRSTNGGASWSVECAMPSAGFLVGLRKTSNGEVIAVQAEGVWLSSGWGTGSVTWTRKVTPNGLAAPQRFSFDGTGLKFIYAEYGPGTGQAWIDSRYAYITTDGGVTWDQAYDSDVVSGNAPADSHVHGVCYDPWNDTFYVSEGHGTGGGVYHSTDDGATWSLAPGMAVTTTMTAAPTCITATDEGLVCGSDSAYTQGLYGVPRTADPMDQTISLTWAWRPRRSGNNGWGSKGFRDPNTGLVYVAFRSQGTGVAPVVAAGTPFSGAKVWEWPADGAAFTVNDFLDGIVVTDDGDLLTPGIKAGVERVVRGRVGAPVSRAQVDSGGMFGGTASDATSLAVGPASTGTAIQAVVSGVGASGPFQDVVVTGFGASATGSQAVVAGSGASGSASDVVIGFAVVGTGSANVLIGAGATGAGTSTAVGRNAKTVAGNAAFGYGAQALVGSLAVALGYGSVTSGSNQIAGGARYLELGEVPTTISNPAANKGRFGFRDNGSGKTEFVVVFPTGAAQVLATEL